MIYRSGFSKTKFQSIAADIIATHILASTFDAERTGLFLSGGSTPGPVYQALSKVDLPWDKVDVGLVDERWVDIDDAGSNAALIQRTLLQNKSKAAKFTAMKTAHSSPQDGQAQLDASYKKILHEGSLAVLGMGTDGHVCSWFPGSDGLEAAIDPSNKNFVQAVTANKSEVTGDYLERMTLTLSALKQCETVLLLISGDEKRDVLETAMKRSASNLPASRLPVSQLLSLDNLTILHAA